MNTTATGTPSTNDDKPFEKGEVIDFCGDEYTVVDNHGNSGRVRSPGGYTMCPFYWTFQGEKCTRVTH